MPAHVAQGFIEARRACERVGVNPQDLVEKPYEQVKYEANSENKSNAITDKIVDMRYYHLESRRRKKLKLVAEYIRNNR